MSQSSTTPLNDLVSGDKNSFVFIIIVKLIGMK
jgi:hypothetical protein